MSRPSPSRLGDKIARPILAACAAKHHAVGRNRWRLSRIHGVDGYHFGFLVFSGLRDSETHCHIRASHPQVRHVNSRPGCSASWGRSRAWKQEGQRRWWSMGMSYAACSINMPSSGIELSASMMFLAAEAESMSC